MFLVLSLDFVAPMFLSNFDLSLNTSMKQNIVNTKELASYYCDHGCLNGGINLPREKSGHAHGRARAEDALAPGVSLCFGATVPRQAQARHVDY